MAFDRSSLHRDEEVVLDLHPHWIMMGKAVIALVLSTAVGIGLLQLGWSGFGAKLLNGGAVLLIVGALLYMARSWIDWYSTNFVLTTDRCIYREGIVAKRGVEIPLDRVNTVFFNQGVLERLVGAGTLTIESAGEHGVQTFEDVRNPMGVQQELYQQIEDQRNRRVTRVDEVGEASPADELAKLADLHARGVLTDEEFAAQKAKLLG
ncbi:MAG: PH domain-containing protein [Actinomycetes bacterium]